MPFLSAQLLETLSGLSTPVIAGCGALHVLAFCLLLIWARLDVRRMAGDLDSFTRQLKYRSVLDRGARLSDQIEAFLADVRDALEMPDRQEDRAALALRMQILDEERRYLQSHSFETCYNICRTMIEAYPLAGVLGTILAIGAALQSGSDAEGSSLIVRSFGQSIWSTAAGLFATVVLMFLNSLVETGFLRLAEHRLHVRDTVARAKRELALSTGGAPSA